ncbi:MAG: zinc dependent phospholipase C family protein [Cyanobacteriota bacterium]
MSHNWTENWTDGNMLRWDSKNPYDSTQSTHLWIVCRAAELASAQPDVGEYIYNLIKPWVSQSDSAFHDAVCNGLWDADEKDPYRNSVVEGDEWYGKLSATYKSHFYDPETGKNWLGETEPTAMTEGVKFFNQALDEYSRGDIRQAGYHLGLSLHYLTDVTQPMHAANFTYLSSLPVGYHSAYESLAIEVMRNVTITNPYIESNLGSDPASYIKAAATTSKRRYADVCSASNLVSWKLEQDAPRASWKNSVEPQIVDALKDAVAITAQYLVVWMKSAFAKQNVSASLIRTQNKGFDTVVALTQKTINAKLRRLFDLGILQPTLNITLLKNAGTLSAQMTAPTVRIRTTNQESVTDPHSVLFVLHFTSGLLTGWDGFGPEAKPKVTQFSAGDLGFKVNLNFEAAEMDTAPSAVKEAVNKLKNLGLGMFSMQQLVMDLQNANLAEYDPEVTSLPKELASNPIFMACLQLYFQDLKSKNGNILGYAITVKDDSTVANSERPSFPPTDLTFGTHLYEPQPGQPLNHDLDTLYYLVMNQNHPFPQNVMPAGNFIDVDRPDIDGRMAIAKSIFVDQFLIPHLSTTITLETDLSQESDRVVSMKTRNGAGTLTAVNNEWNYQVSKDIQWGSHEGGGKTFPSDIYWKVEHTCNVSIPVGTNIVSISGQSLIYSSVECWAGVKKHALSEKVWVQSTIQWSLQLVFPPVSSNGSLAVNVTQQVHDPVSKSGGNFLGQFEHIVNPNVDKEAASIAQTLKDTLSKIDIQRAVTHAFEGHNAFFFPGGDTFDFSDPVFNANQDLVATVTIRGL